MIQFLRKIFFPSLEKKVKTYISLQEDIELIKSDKEDLVKNWYEKMNSFKNAIDQTKDEDIIKAINVKKQELVKQQVSDICSLKERQDSIQKSLDLMKKDEVLMKAVQDHMNLSVYDLIKSKYKEGSIKREHYDDLIKAKTGNLKYADVIVRDKEHNTLLLKRTPESDFAPMKWCLPGGHIDLNEDHEAAAKRELMEETGLIAESCTLSKVYKKDDIEIYYYDVNFGEIKPEIILESDEHIDYKWYSHDELRKLKPEDLIMDLYENLGLIGYVEDLNKKELVKKTELIKSIDNYNISEDSKKLIKDLLEKSDDNEEKKHLKKMIKEHKRLVDVLSGVKNPSNEVKKELKIQKSELESYEKELSEEESEENQENED
jgi:8-oxo-dGTP pyrophosphatase MutT (NUDIX family)